MAAPSLWVKKEIQLAAALQFKGKNFREAVETLLTNDLSFEDDGMNTPGKIDAGPLLQTALGFLTQQPHAALGVEIGAGMKEIRSNYKKLAVKYHPVRYCPFVLYLCYCMNIVHAITLSLQDKNPKTTVLFQAINTACARLSDRELRKVAERSAPSSSSSSSTMPNPPNSTHRPPPYAAHPSTSESTPAEVARKAAEERRKREAEAARAKVNFARRAEEAMLQEKKEEEETKKRQEEELRKRKDDIIREGQRAYHEEHLRAQRESQIRQERRAAEISAAATRAKQTANVPPIDIPGLKSFREGTKSTQAKGALETGIQSLERILLSFLFYNL